MFGSRVIPKVVAGVVGALTLGGLATYLRLLADSASLVPSALTVSLCVVAISIGVVVGSRGRPDETAYW